MKSKNRKIDNIFCIFCIKITCFRSKLNKITHLKQIESIRKY